MLKRLLRLTEAVVTDAQVVGCARLHAVEVDGMMEEFQGIRIKLHLKEQRSHLERQIIRFADGKIGVPDLPYGLSQLLLLQFGDVGQTFPESLVIPAAQSEEGEQMFQAQSFIDLLDACLEREEIVRPEFFNRLGV